MPKARTRVSSLEQTSTIHNSLSRLQFSCMKLFWDQPRGWIMPVEDALNVDLRPFDSLARRGYLEYLMGKRGFKCSHFGWDIKTKWDETNVWKGHPSRQFGSYLRTIEALSGEFNHTEKGIVRVLTKRSNLRVLTKAS